VNRWTDRAVGALGFVASAVVLRLLSGSHAGPFVTDEAGYLGNARWLGGTGGRWLMDTSPYYRWGYSVLLVPVHWITSDPADQFRLVLLVNLVLLASLFPILYTLVRRTLDPPVWVAAVAAGVAVVYPGVGSSSGMAMAENLLVSLFALSVLAYYGFVRGEGLLGWCFGLCVLGLWASHRRVAFVVALALMAIAVAVWADRRRLRAGIVNAAVLVVGFVPVTLIDHALVAERWLRIRRPEELGGGVRSMATSPHDWVTFLQRMVGQSWYLLAGSLGLVAFGAVCLARARSVPGGSWRSRLRDPVALTAWFQLASVVAMAAITSIFFTVVTTRPDQRVYGRYIDMVLPPVLAAGVVWVLQRPWRQVAGVAVAGIGALAASTLLLLVPHGTGNFAGAYPVTQVASIAWLDKHRIPLVAATLVAGAALLAVAVTARLHATVIALAGIVVVYAVAVQPVQDFITKGQQYRNGYRTFPMQIDRIGDVGTLAFAIDQQARGEATAIQFWMGRRDMVPWPAGSPSPEPWAIAPIDSQRAIAAGGRQVFRDTRVHAALWVMPGPEQDRMAAAGRLLPADLSAPLPAPGRQGQLSAIGPTTLRAKPGDHLELHLRVRNDGDEPWIDFASYQGRGVVRVAAGKARGDLPSTLWPGQSAEVDIPLDVSGSQQVQVSLIQEAVSAFDQIKPLTYTLQVAP
jgi:hypothetical protein